MAKLKDFRIYCDCCGDFVFPDIDSVSLKLCCNECQRDLAEITREHKPLPVRFV